MISVLGFTLVLTYRPALSEDPTEAVIVSHSVQCPMVVVVAIGSHACMQMKAMLQIMEHCNMRCSDGGIELNEEAESIKCGNHLSDIILLLWAVLALY